MHTLVAVGRTHVVREVRAAAPLMTALHAPVTARGPWLTAALNAGAAAWPGARPVAVVVATRGQGPEATAFLALRRRGLTTVVTMLGGGVESLPGGRPTARLLARDEQAAGLLADGVHDLLAALRRPWSLELGGLPMGDPTSRRLAARLPTSVLGNVRSVRLLDSLDDLGPPALRSRDPRVLERWLPALLAAADPRARTFLRATARLHAAIGQLELAVLADGDTLLAGLLTLVDGEDRWPWWGTGAGMRTEMGTPLVGLTAAARGRPAPSPFSRGAAR